MMIRFLLVETRLEIKSCLLKICFELELILRPHGVQMLATGTPCLPIRLTPFLCWVRCSCSSLWVRGPILIYRAVFVKTWLISTSCLCIWVKLLSTDEHKPLQKQLPRCCGFSPGISFGVYGHGSGAEKAAGRHIQACNQEEVNWDRWAQQREVRCWLWPVVPGRVFGEWLLGINLSLSYLMCLYKTDVNFNLHRLTCRKQKVLE